MMTREDFYGEMRAWVKQDIAGSTWPLHFMGAQLFSKFGRRNFADIVRTAILKHEHEAGAADTLLKDPDIIQYVRSNGKLKKLLAGRVPYLHRFLAAGIQGDSVLDVRSGSARFAAELWSSYDRADSFSLTHYDPTGTPEVSYGEYTSTLAGYADHSFDSALAVSVFNRCDDPNAELREVTRVSRRLIVIDSVNDDCPREQTMLAEWVMKTLLKDRSDLLRRFPSKTEYLDLLRSTGWRLADGEYSAIHIGPMVIPKDYWGFVLVPPA